MTTKRAVSRTAKILLAFLLAALVASCASTGNNGFNSDVTIYLVRHGRTMLNTTDRVQGWADAVLTQPGIDGAEFLSEGLNMAGVRFAAAYSSDSGRSVQTANIIIDKTGYSGAPLVTGWRLREFNFGTFEGMPNHDMWTEIAADLGLTLEQWLSTPISTEHFANAVARLDVGRDPDGVNWPAEDYATIQRRLVAGITDIANEVSGQGGGNVLVVSHGLSIAALVNELDSSFPAAPGIQNSSVTIITFKDGRFEVSEYGSTRFLEAGQAGLGRR